MASESEASPFLPRRRKTNSLAEEVTKILLAAKKPLHVSEIISELQKTSYPITAKNPSATIAVALSRRPFEFEKVGPNTFVLAPMREGIETVEEIKLREG